MRMPRRGSVAVLLSIGIVILVAVFGWHLFIVRKLGKSPATSSQPAAGGRSSSPTSMGVLSIGSSPADNGTPDARSIEVCGAGRVALQSEETSFAAVARLNAGTEDQWLSALRNSGDLRARAAGLYFEDTLAPGKPTSAEANDNREALVQLALGTSEPSVYATALAMCKSLKTSKPPEDCRQLTAEHWAQLDPENVVPWLMVANEASQKSDGLEESIAFRHAAAATRADSYATSLYAFAAPELPADASPLSRSFLATEAIGVEAAMPIFEYGYLNRRCSAEALRSDDVHMECAEIASLLVNHGPSVMDLGIGTSIGSRLGWSRGKISELTQRQHALMAILTEEVDPRAEDQQWTCDEVQRVNKYMQQRVLLGEVQAMSELIDRSGKSVSQLSQEYDRRVAELLRDARQSDAATVPATSAPEP